MSQRIFLIGDEDKAIAYANYAKGKLRLMKEQMSRLGIPEMSANFSVDDALITVSSSYGQDTIYISVGGGGYYIIAYLGETTCDYSNKKFYKLSGKNLIEISEAEITEYVLQDSGTYCPLPKPEYNGNANPLEREYLLSKGLGIINPDNGVTYKFEYNGAYHYILTSQWEREIFFPIEETPDIGPDIPYRFVFSKLSLLFAPLSFETRGTDLIYNKDTNEIIVNTKILSGIDTNVGIVESKSTYIDNVRAQIVKPSHIVVYNLNNNEKTIKKITSFIDTKAVVGFDKDLNIYQYLMFCNEATALFKNKTEELFEYSFSPKGFKGCSFDVGIITVPNFTYTITIDGNEFSYTSTESDSSSTILENLSHQIDTKYNSYVMPTYFTNCEPFLGFDSAAAVEPSEIPYVTVSDNIYIIGANVTFNLSKYKCYLDYVFYPEYGYYREGVSSTGINTIKPRVKLPFYINGEISDYVEANRTTNERGIITKMRYGVYCNSKLVDEEIFTPITYDEYPIKDPAEPIVSVSNMPLQILKHKYLILHTHHSENFDFILFAKANYKSHRIIDHPDMYFWFGSVFKMSILEVENIIEYYVWVNGVLHKIPDASMRFWDYTIFEGKLLSEHMDYPKEDIESGKAVQFLMSHNYSNVSYLFDGTEDKYDNSNLNRPFTDVSIDGTKLLFSYDLYPIKIYNTIKSRRADQYTNIVYPAYDFSKGYYPFADAQKLKDRKWLLFDINGLYTEIETPKTVDKETKKLVNYERLNGVGIF